MLKAEKKCLGRRVFIVFSCKMRQYTTQPKRPILIREVSKPPQSWFIEILLNAYRLLLITAVAKLLPATFIWQNKQVPRTIKNTMSDMHSTRSPLDMSLILVIRISYI